MLVNTKEILEDARKNYYAVGAFNINNMEILQAVITAAEQEHSPVILQTSEGAIKYAGTDYLSAMVHLAASKAKVPVALHLDHGTTYKTIMGCIAGGWTSVMIDGSHFPSKKMLPRPKRWLRWRTPWASR
jgi:fructose-bisphosphate aldolase class II